jgi:hypothetical protein
MQNTSEGSHISVYRINRNQDHSRYDSLQSFSEILYINISKDVDLDLVSDAIQFSQGTPLCCFRKLMIANPRG